MDLCKDARGKGISTVLVMFLVYVFAIVVGADALGSKASCIEDSYKFLPVKHISPFHVVSDNVYTPDTLSKLQKRDVWRSPHVRQLSFTAYNMTFVLELSPKNDLFHPQFRMTTQHSGKSHKVLDQNVMKRIVAYTGTAHLASSPEQGGPARIVISTAGDKKVAYQGEFFVGSVLFHVKPADVYHKMKTLKDVNYLGDKKYNTVVYSESSLNNIQSLRSGQLYRDLGSYKQSQTDFDSLLLQSIDERVAEYASNGSTSCSNDAYGLGTHSLFSARLSKRGNVRISSVATCQGQARTLYVGVAVDCTYARVIGSPVNILSQVLSVFNSVSTIYERQFSISIAIADLLIMQECGAGNLSWNRECEKGYTIYNRLSDFSLWRGSTQNTNAGAWHLLTSCSSGNSLGIAWTKELCTYNATYISDSSSAQSGYVSGTAVSSIGREQYKIVAHELGHNFGANHDCSGSCTSSCCACSGSCDCSAQYLMHPTDASATDYFSPCSVNVICQNLANGGGTCMKTSGSVRALEVNQCGNGVVEDGEECDSDSSCCTSSCKLVSGAQCDPSASGCCTSTCQIASVGTVCRANRSSCDYAETCTGKSPVCPPDSYKEDGTSCSDNPNAKCASGFCTSRSQMCLDRQGSLNITGSCTQSSAKAECTITCALQDGSCTSMAGYFVDGLECGYKGRCKAGNCVTTNGIYAFITWGMKHVAAAIVLTILIIVALIALLFAIFWFVRSKLRKRAKPQAGNCPKIDTNFDKAQTDGIVTPLGSAYLKAWKSAESPQPEIWNEAAKQQSPLNFDTGAVSYGSSHQSTRVNSPSNSMDNFQDTRSRH